MKFSDQTDTVPCDEAPKRGGLCHDITEAQRDIDRDIERHSQAILSLKYQRNRLSLISRLPAEIISRIFYFFKLSQPSYVANYGRLSWIRISHVSSHWRDVALNSPTLWADPPMHNEEWRTEMIKRSKMAKLTITTDLADAVISTGERIVAAVKEAFRLHTPRIQHISITNIRGESRGVLNCMPVSAPQVETLHISSVQPFYDSIDEAPCIPDAAFQDSMRLRSLVFSGISVRWHLYHLQDVTRLKLHHLPVGSRLTTTQFVDALRTMTKLESLDINHAIGPKDSNDLSAYTPIDLPRLQDLTMFSQHDELQTFFRHFSFPATATVNLVLLISSDLKAKFTVILSYIAAIYAAPTRKFRTMVLDMQHHGFGIKLDVGSADGNSAVSQEVNFVLRVSLGMPADMTLSEFFNSGMKLDDIDHVRFNGDIDYDADVLRQTVGVLPNLSHITTYGRHINGLLEALFPSEEGTESEGLCLPVYFVDLAHLRLVGLIFETSESRLPPECYINLDELGNCLIQRYEFGCDIHKLVLEDCYELYEDDVEELKGIVVDVEWDGIEQEEERDDDYDTNDDELYLDGEDYEEDYPDSEDWAGYFHGHDNVF